MHCRVLATSTSMVAAGVTGALVPLGRRVEAAEWTWPQMSVVSLVSPGTPVCAEIRVLLHERGLD